MGLFLDLASARHTIQRMRHYMDEDMWRSEPPPSTTLEGIGVRALRLVYLLLQGTREDQLRLHAAALTLTTLMSLVPLLALALAMLKGMGFQDEFISFLNSYLADMPAEFHAFLNDLIDLVERTNFARLGGIGATVLLIMVVGMLGRIEQSFNHIWGIRKSRALRTRIINYLGIVIVVPVLLVVAITLNAQIHLGGALAMELTVLTPLLATWAAFSILYESMPNTKVHPGPAVFSGLIGAILWELWFQVYITIQPGVTNYNAIYGTLAGIPIFLAWLTVSWTIVLMGAKITFVAQTSGSWRPFGLEVNASWNTRLALSLTILSHAARSLKGGSERVHRLHLANFHGIPACLLDDILICLVDAGWIAELKEHSDEFVMLVDPGDLTVGDILDVLGHQGENVTTMQIEGLPKRIVNLTDQVVPDEAGLKLTMKDLA